MFKFPVFHVSHVVSMAYCINCGEKLPQDACFCPKCGYKTQIAGTTAIHPSDELRDSFYKVGEELERAFNLAAKEIHDAFQTARTNMRQSVVKEPIICPNCGEKNSGNSAFCSKCGKKLEPKTTSRSQGKT
jgi:ribosomal protein L40E